MTVALPFPVPFSKEENTSNIQALVFCGSLFGGTTAGVKGGFIANA
jgi:hypothetical protein